MTDRNRWVMILAIVLAVAAISADHIRHRPPYASQHDDETDTPCTMGLEHEEEDEEDEL